MEYRRIQGELSSWALVLYLLLAAKVPPVIGFTQSEAEERVRDAGLDPAMLKALEL